MVGANRVGGWCINMAFTSFQNFCEAAHLAQQGGFVAVRGRWLAAQATGGTETLPEFLLRESGQAEETYLDRVAEAFETGNGWINSHNVVVHGVPYAGVKKSGMGRGVVSRETLLDYYRNISIIRPL